MNVKVFSKNIPLDWVDNTFVIKYTLVFVCA